MRTKNNGIDSLARRKKYFYSYNVENKRKIFKDRNSVLYRLF